MLYLNDINCCYWWSKFDLTLTSVVFEFEMDEEVIKKAEHLTLTSVVFE